MAEVLSINRSAASLRGFLSRVQSNEDSSHYHLVFPSLLEPIPGEPRLITSLAH